MYYDLADAAYLLQGQPMFKILSRIKEMERAGENIVHFEIGDPDFSTPQDVIDAGIDALRNGFTHYSDSMGDYDFREIVAENNLHTRGFKPDIGQVLVTPGANMMIYYAVRCLVNPGDEVIVQNPCFPTYLSVFNFCGVKPVGVPLYEKNGFRLNPKDLEDRITDKTRLIIINSPHNPTGAVMHPEELEEIGKIAIKNKIYLYSDEIYARMNYGDVPFYSPSILDKCKEYIIVANGFSKAFAMTGWRLGVGIGPEKVMEKMGLLLQTTSSCVPSFIQRAGIAAIKGSQEPVNAMMAEYKERRDILVKGLNEIDKIECLNPGGAFYVFPNIKKTGLTSEQFASQLLEKGKVGVCAGSDFGASGEGYIRMCYATSKKDIIEGIKRIKSFVEGLKEEKMRVCDLIADYIYRNGINDVFMVSGGGLMFLTDGLACNDKLNKICCHHEQGAAMAAVAYAKYKGMGCAYVTTGCGGTNTVTGVLHAWQDNVPCVFISGQCKRKETLEYIDLPIRQVGVQEADIVSIVKSITKYAVVVDNKDDILYHLEKAFYLARNGRPGPVWIDVPMDIQSAEIDINTLRHFDPSELKPVKTQISQKEIDGLVNDMKNARRPVIIAGHGVRLAGATEQFSELVHRHNIPVVFSRLGTDVMPTTDDLNIGRIGNKGTRAANFALQNADLVIAIGSRLSVSSTGQEYEYFARNAKVIAIDIDKYEHLKNTVHIEQVIQADAKDTIVKLLSQPWENDYSDWACQCLKWKQKYPVCLAEYYEDDSQGINMYLFVEELSKYFKEDSVLVTDAGSAVYVPAQGIKTSDKKQRYITSGAQAEMGFTLPGTVGVCAARGGKEVLGITGDGSFQMNIQELQTLVYNKFPVKLFVWNNDGYLSIRATQNKFFNGRFIGTDSTSGVSFPDLEKIAGAYGIDYFKIDKIKDIEAKMPEIMQKTGPVLCEVRIIRDQEVIPSVSSKKMPDGKLVSAPIEDMYPFLPREEIEENMSVSENGGGNYQIIILSFIGLLCKEAV